MRCLGKNSSLLRLEFLSGFMNRLEFLVTQIFLKILKTIVDYGFLSNPPVEETVNSIILALLRLLCTGKTCGSYFTDLFLKQRNNFTLYTFKQK